MQHAVVLPAYHEPVAALKNIHNALSSQISSVLILVLNEPQQVDSVTAPEQGTRHCLAWLRSDFSASWQSPCQRLQLYAPGNKKSASCVLLVNCYETHYRLPPEQGVGLARKLGADLACRLISSGKIKSPWIFNTDADVQLPPNYLQATDTLNGDQSIAACTLPFRHLPADDTEMNETMNEALYQAQALYDLRLNYQYHALAWANSPYAYRAIGSCMIVHTQHYAQVRGFPKRSAGEDFHLLNKLAKTGRVANLRQPTIGITTRLSQRTPFGTGQAIAEIMQLSNPADDYLYYHPAIFAELKKLLGEFKSLWQQDQPKLNAPTLHALEELQLGQAIIKAKQNSTTAEAFTKHLHNWFDGLKTLRFIHLLRDNRYPSVNRQELIKNLPDELATAIAAEDPLKEHKAQS